MGRGERGWFKPMLTQVRAIALPAALLVAFGTGMNCGGTGVRIDSPGDLALLTTDSLAVSASAGPRFDTASIAVAVDGVDLVAALGLVPPFTGQSGVVSVGGSLLSVANFDIQQASAGAPNRIDVDLSGLASGSHALVVSALNDQSALRSAQADFEVVDFFTQDASALTAAGPSKGGLSTLPNAALGEAVAAPPIATAGGETVRSGFVERAEQLLAGAP